MGRWSLVVMVIFVIWPEGARGETSGWEKKPLFPIHRPASNQKRLYKSCNSVRFNIFKVSNFLAYARLKIHFQPLGGFKFNDLTPRKNANFDQNPLEKSDKILP